MCTKYCENNNFNVKDQTTYKEDAEIKDTKLSNDQINFNKNSLEEYEMSLIDSNSKNKIIEEKIGNNIMKTKIEKSKLILTEKDEGEEDWNLVEKEDI